MTVQDGLQAMKLQDLKNKKPADLLAFAEELEIENASSMRKQDMLFAILKELAEREVEIMGPTGRAGGGMGSGGLGGVRLMSRTITGAASATVRRTVSSWSTPHSSNRCAARMMPTNPRRSEARNGAGGSSDVRAFAMVSADMTICASLKIILMPTRMIRK